MPARSGGAQASGVSVGRNWKLTTPSSSLTSTYAAGSVGSGPTGAGSGSASGGPGGGVGQLPLPAGGAAQVVGFASGRRSATSRGQAVSASAAGGVNADVAGRRLLVTGPFADGGA